MCVHAQTSSVSSITFLYLCGFRPRVHVSVCLSPVHVARGDAVVCMQAQSWPWGFREAAEARQADSRPLSGHWCRCVEEPPGGLLALEPMPTFGKGLDLRRTAEETFEVKDVLNSTLDSETLKQTLYRQAKNQVGTYQSLPPTFPRLDGRPQLCIPDQGPPPFSLWPSHVCMGDTRDSSPPMPIALARETPK